MTSFQAWTDTLLFAYFPYLALGVFLTGFYWRFTKHNDTVQALSTQYLSNDRDLKVGSNLFHFAIIGVFFGHIFGLLAPEPLYIWLISNETKRILAIIGGGAAGLVALVGIVMLAKRRFTNERVLANSTFADKLAVVLIMVQIITGLLGTVVTAFSPLEAYLTIDHWAQGLFIFNPRPEHYLAATSFIHKLHIVLGFVIFCLFPFTKLMHMVVIPLKYFVARNRVMNVGGR